MRWVANAWLFRANGPVMEIVGNLTAVEAGVGEPERHTLTAAEGVERAQPWIYKVPL